MTMDQVARSPSPPPILVIGLGNPWRGDDGLGPAVVEKLARLNLPWVSLQTATGDAAGLLERWAGAQTVILVDAVSSGAAAGTVFRFEAQDGPLPEDYFAGLSSHALGLAQAVELGRTLGKLPPRLIVYGIEGKSFAPGGGLSGDLAPVVAAVAAQILKDLAE